MSSLLESLAQSLGPEAVSKMSNEIGADEEKTSEALGLAVPALIAALRKNVSQPGGAEALMGALKRDHDGSILDRVSDFLGQKKQPEEQQGANRMLDHIFGNKRDRVEEGVSKASGLQKSAASELMKMLGPMVLAALAKQVTTKKVGEEQLPGYLEDETKQLEVKEKKFSLLGKFLDQDGDGDFDFSDITKLGVGLLFKRK